jgi:hypothetical protein
MNVVMLLLNPRILLVLTLFASIVWMLMDESDRTRPFLVFGLVVNIFFGTLLNLFMTKEDSLLPWKYDHILFQIDKALGISAASIALPLQSVWRIPLLVIYHSSLPMMICWLLVTRYQNSRWSILPAYIAELVAGPILYAILPACGPIYAFGAGRFQPLAVPTSVVRFDGMPNAFPSLHIGIACVFVLFAQGKFWRGASLAFLAGTALSTLSTGEHYVIDLIPGLVFGCFALGVAQRKVRRALLYLGVVLAWSLTVRFYYLFLIAHPGLLRTCATATVALAVFAVFQEWRLPAMSAPESALVTQQ